MSKSIDEMLEDAVTGGLQGFLGDTAKVLNVFLDPALAVRKPDSYVNSVSKFLPADKNVEGLVLAMCGLLYEYLGLPFEERAGWKLSDYVNDATAKVRASSDYRKAQSVFKKVADDYRNGAKKIPRLASLFSEMASCMEAWSLIEEARLRHGEEQYQLAAEDYARAADLFRTTTAWAYLSRYNEASSIMEKGEALSRQEKEDDSAKLFKSAAEAFVETQTSLKNKRDQISGPQEQKELDNWLEASRALEKYCLGRVKLEEAKILDKRGAEVESQDKYRSASNTFRELVSETQSAQSRVELEALGLFCEARAKMKEAETMVAPELYSDAADLFSEVEKVTQGRTFRHLALASSCICRALESGTKFRRTRDTQLYSEIKRQLETATDYYEAAGWQQAAGWTRATGKLFDALVYLTEGATERDSRKKTELYSLAEKHLQLSAKLYGQANFLSKQEEALRLLDRAREEKELLLSPVEALAGNPALTGVPGAPASLINGQMGGLERLEEARVVGNLTVPETDVKMGSELIVELELANVGKAVARLVKLENIGVEGVQLDTRRMPRQVKGDFIDMKGEKLEYMGTHEVKIPMRAVRAGVFQLQPRIMFVDAKGAYRSYEFEPVSLTVRELGISGWLKGPK
jgi:tetratricopeptide (TPR) repeat protein